MFRRALNYFLNKPLKEYRTRMEILRVSQKPAKDRHPGIFCSPQSFSAAYLSFTKKIYYKRKLLNVELQC